MKIAISAGHNSVNPGAVNGKTSEFSIAARVVGLIVGKLQDQGHSAYLITSGRLSVKIAQINKISARVGLDAAIEIHFNAGGGYGTECLYAPGSVGGATLAAYLQQELVIALGTRDRGIKEGWYKMVTPPDPAAVSDAFLTKTTPWACILEPFFIDTQLEDFCNLEMYNIIAEAIVVGLEKWDAENN